MGKVAAYYPLKNSKEKEINSTFFFNPGGIFQLSQVIKFYESSCYVPLVNHFNLEYQNER
jgi:hypothetical protein